MAVIAMTGRWRRQLLAGMGVALLVQIVAPLSTGADGPFPWPLPPQYSIVDLPVNFPTPMAMPSTAGDPTQPIWPVTDALTQLANQLLINGDSACGGCSSSTVPPTVTVATQSARTTYSRGEAVGLTVTVTNTQHQKVTVNSLTNPVPTGFATMPAATVTFDGQPCTATTSPSCTVSGGSLSVSSFTLDNGGQHVLAFAMVATGGDRGCYQTQDQAHIVTGSGTITGGSPVLSVCDGGLGHEPWWSYTTTAIGPQGAAAMNAGDGNLVIAQSDTTAIPGHARLSFQVHRVYNSEDTGNAAAPNAFGIGWGVDFESWDSSPAGVAGVAALYVPPAESVAVNHPVTVIDDGGSRQVVTLATLPTPIDVASLAASQPLGTLIPKVLTLDTVHYNHLCVDEAANGAAPGVHLGMWRYTEVSAASSSTPCTPATGTQPVVVGWGAERPDRIRYEFSWNGYKLDAVDGNGNEVRYAYAASPAAGTSLGALQHVTEVSTGRGFTLASPSSTETDITDAAQRVTKYMFDAGGHLTSVVNPDGSTITYTYGGCAGATASQLCATTDPRAHSTSFTYTTTWSDGTQVVGPPKLARISDRSGATSIITHVHSPDSVTVDLGIERTLYDLVDASGSAAEIDGIDMTTPSSPTTLHKTLLTWDTASGGATCRQPDPAIDHNLCRSFRQALNGTSTAEDTSYVYDPMGDVAIERQCLASADTASAAPCPASTPSAVSSRDSTSAHHSQYVEAGGTVGVYDDSLPGGGTVTTPGPSSGTRWDGQTLYAIYDETATLGGRGNAPGLTSSQVTPYLTTTTVDDASTANPNATVSSGTCNGNSGNTGNVCLEQMPSTGTSVNPVYRYTYFAQGDRASMQSPVDYAAGIPATSYTYYADTDKDLSGTTSAGGWLKATTAPTGDATVYAYDAAGNATRTWEPNAVAGIAVASFPGTITAPASTAYKEVLHGPGAGATTTAYSAPWRYVLSERDALGETTVYQVDADGNQTVIRSPRGYAAGSTAYDIIQTFDNRDALLTKQMPVEAANGIGPWRYSYDAAGNRISATDPRGAVTAYVFDAVNRQVKTIFTRGPWSTDSNNPNPPSCTQSTSASPVPAGRTMCNRTVAYDGTDNPTALGDASGQVTSVTYDGLHREVSRLVPRNDGTFTTLRTDRVYDLDGNVVSLCSPRAFTEGKAPNCTSAAAQPYRRDRTYDTRSHETSESTMQAAGGNVNTTSYAYDADGNQVSVTDANGHVHTFTYDGDDRKVGESWQRVAGGPTLTKTWSFDHTGNVLSEVDGSSRIGYAYDAADRRTDTVAGWDGSTSILTAVASADGGTNAHTRQTYDAAGNVTAEYDARAFTSSGVNQAYVTTNVYDNDDRLTTVDTPRFDGAAASDQSVGGSVQAGDCPTGAAGYPAGVGVCVTTYQYDGDNNKTRETLPTATSNSNRYITYSYSDDNLLLVENDPSPAQGGARVNDMTYLYDANGKAVKVTDALGRPTSTTYTSDELVASVNDEPNGPTSHLIAYQYDANNNRTKVTDANGNSTTSTFTTDDLLASSTDADSDKTSYTYDNAGNPVQVFSPDANARTVSDVAGTPTTNTYTFDNLLLSTTAPVSTDGTSQLRRTTYTYTDFGAKATQSNQLVNSSGSVLSDSGTMTYTYYPDQRLQTQYSRLNQLAIVRSYDAAGHPTSVAQGPGATPGQPLPAPTTTVSATYYLDGLVRSATDQVSAVAGGASNATTSYGYDGAGDMTSRNQVLTNGHQYTTNYAMNDAGRVSSMTASTPAATWNWSYDAAGQVTSESIPNGLTVSYTYAPDGTISVRNLAQGSSSPLANWVYMYDAAGHRTQETLHGYDANNQALNVTLSYQYTPGGRLSSFGSTNPDGSARPTQSVTWDPDGNRLTFGGITYTYNGDDSIATSSTGPGGTTRNYAYSPAGGMTSDGCISYAYDGFDRLSGTSGTRTSGCPIADYVQNTYDGLDRKIAHTDGPFGEVSGEHYDGLTDTLLTDQHEWSNNPDIVYVLDPSSKVAADVFWPQGFNHAEFLSDDGYDTNGTVVNSTAAVACDSITDPFGSPLYNPFGTNPCHTGSTTSQVVYKSAQRVTACGGACAYEMGSRDFHPVTDTFIERDEFRGSANPAFTRLEATSGQLLNKYSYARGDPVNFSDPSGHYPCRDEEADGGCDQATRIDQVVTQKGGVAPSVKRWIATERAGRKYRAHLFDKNAQRTENIGGGTDFGISIDMMTMTCFTCNGTREHDGRTYGFSGKQGTWDCSPATKGSSCDESHTYRWTGKKIQEYDDGVRTIGGLIADAGHWIWDHKVDIGMLALNFVPGVGEVADAVEMARVAEVGEEAVNAIHTAVDAASVANEAEKAGSVAEEVGQASEEGTNAAEKASESCDVNSFTGDTPVVLTDGSLRPISQIKPGDKVRTTDPTTGTTVLASVSKVYRNDDTNLTDLTFRNAGGAVFTLHTTQHHRFWDDTRGGWVDAADLGVGDEVKSDAAADVRVTSVQSWFGSEWRYDITVDGVHTFYVVAGREDLLVHNCGGGSLDLLKGSVNKHGTLESGADVSRFDAVSNAKNFLGEGSQEIAPNVWRSADGLRRFRMTSLDHANFEMFSDAADRYPIINFHANYPDWP
jgi:RHS repeat-associated protein